MPPNDDIIKCANCGEELGRRDTGSMLRWAHLSNGNLRCADGRCARPQAKAHQNPFTGPTSVAEMVADGSAHRIAELEKALAEQTTAREVFELASDTLRAELAELRATGLVWRKAGEVPEHPIRVLCLTEVDGGKQLDVGHCHLLDWCWENGIKMQKDGAKVLAWAELPDPARVLASPDCEKVKTEGAVQP